MEKSRIKYWISALRPKTLPASFIPVLIACALAYKDRVFNFVPAIVCVLFALLAQIVSNLLNDYFDFVNGKDKEDRIGPDRAVSKGWISPKTMFRAASFVLLVACLLGCILIYYAGLKLVWIGLLVCVFIYAYSAGPYPLAEHGWGDVCVLVFYGIIPVVMTYYVQSLRFDLSSLICGLAVGIVSINILVSNNFRDRFQDAAVNKRTSIVLFGEEFGIYFYLLNGIAAVLLCAVLAVFRGGYFYLLPVFYLYPHIKTWKTMKKIDRGPGLNKILGMSARNTMVFGILLSAGIIMS